MRKPTVKVTLRLFDGDKDELSTMFPSIGYNAVVRQLVHNFVKGVKEREMRSRQGLTSAQNINIDELLEEAKLDDN
jgi:hypothetical protein